MEQRITSLLLPAPEAELEASCKELDEKVTWLLHNYGHEIELYTTRQTGKRDKRQ